MNVVNIKELKAMQIQVTIKSVYGNETIYPHCQQAKGFADLLNQKTLTRRDLTKIKAMGYEIGIVNECGTIWE